MLIFGHIRFWVAALPLIVLAAGCNKGSAMVKVHGKVFYVDGSVPKGGVRVVRFEPLPDTPPETRRVASGQIESDGSFELFTRRPGDGVYPGEYNITFTVWKDPHDPVSLIQDKFTASATTPIRNIKVDRDKDDYEFKIEAKPAAGTAASAASEAKSQAHQ